MKKIIPAMMLIIVVVALMVPIGTSTTTTVPNSAAISFPEECAVAAAYGFHSRTQNRACLQALENNLT